MKDESEGQLDPDFMPELHEGDNILFIYGQDICAGRFIRLLPGGEVLISRRSNFNRSRELIAMRRDVFGENEMARVSRRVEQVQRQLDSHLRLIRVLAVTYEKGV